MVKITIVGAAGGIGQSLSLLLKTQLLPEFDKYGLDELALFDRNADGGNGLATDLSHIDTPLKVVPYSNIDNAVKGANIITIVAGVPRKPGMTREDLFSTNSKILGSFAKAIANNVDLNNAVILIVTNPINALVPNFNKILTKLCGFDTSSKILGITKLDSVRAVTFLHTSLREHDIHLPLSMFNFPVPVVGGHAGTTIVPLYSHSLKSEYLDNIERLKLVRRVQQGGDEVVRAKNGQGSATMAMAFAGVKVIADLYKVYADQEKTIEGIFYVAAKGPGSDKLLKLVDCQYFGTTVRIGKKGIEYIDTSVLENADDFEKKQIRNECIPILRKSIKMGLEN